MFKPTKIKPLPLLDPAGPRLASRYGGQRELRKGYFCVFFILPPEPRRSILCHCPRCPDLESCRRSAGPSRRVYDRVINYAVNKIEQELLEKAHRARRSERSEQ